jgi:hypothetical protein
MYENCGQNNFNLSLCLLRTTTPFWNSMLQQQQMTQSKAD